MYDVAVIGAGINGTTIAYELKKAGRSVVLFDMDSIASGGSGAAGAFISPKFSKGGKLKELLHDAFLYSMDFYEENFPHYFTKAPLLHIAKDDMSNENVKQFKKNTTLPLKTPSSDILQKITHEAQKYEYICLDTGVVQAKQMCEALAQDIELKNERVSTLSNEDGVWMLNEKYTASKVVLAIGAYEKLINEPYINMRGVWGHRIDIQTSTKNSYFLHQHVSISSSKNGIVAIGATHNVHYHPEDEESTYNIDDGREELLEKASKTLILENIKILKDYTGLRSGSIDYIPTIGSLVDSEKTLQNRRLNFTKKKQDYTLYNYYENLYIINGSGGYGFVLAPYLAKMLSEHILYNTNIDKELLPARFFARWAKKLHS